MSCVVPAPAPSRPRIADVLPVLLVIAGGCALRFLHLGTFSLWWDEIVHVWTAQGGTIADVWTHAKQGIPAGYNLRAATSGSANGSAKKAAPSARKAKAGAKATGTRKKSPGKAKSGGRKTVKARR